MTVRRFQGQGRRVGARRAAARSAGLLLPAILFVAAMTASAAAVSAAGLPAVFVVAGVPVDATAENAVAAREAARTEGARTAFRRLLERLTLPADWPRLPQPVDQAILNLVQDVEVSNERSSAVRYLAKYTFRFNPAGVRQLLRSAGVPFTELASKPVVIAPVLKQGGSVKLWDDPNPWRDAWNSVPGKYGLVPWVVPVGDAGDVAALDAPEAEAPKPEQLQALSGRYGDGDVVVATAVPGSDGAQATLDLAVTRYGPDASGQPATVRVAGPKPDAALYQAGVEAAVRELEDEWKKMILSPSSSEETVIEARVPIAAAADWGKVRERLAKVPIVRGVEVEFMTRDAVHLKLKARGDQNMVKVALAQQDLVLAPGGKTATLTFRQPAGPAPAAPADSE